MTFTGIDLSPAMLSIAEQRAADLGLEADLRTGDAEQLPFEDESFDTVVCTLSRCTIPDPVTADRRDEAHAGPWWPPAAARPYKKHLAADLRPTAAAGTTDHPRRQ